MKIVVEFIGFVCGQIVVNFMRGYVKGKTGVVSKTKIEEVAELASSNKIGAIKLHREYFDSSLLDAKNIVEDIIRKQNSL